MASIGGGGTDILIGEPDGSDGGSLGGPLSAAILELQDAIADPNATVVVYDPNNPPGPPPPGQIFVLMLDAEAIAAAGGSITNIVIPSGVTYLVVEDGINVPITGSGGTPDAPLVVIGGVSSNSYSFSGSVRLVDSGGNNLAIITDADNPSGSAGTAAAEGSEIRFGDGADTIVADSGNDTVVAGLGNDVIFLGAGDDVTYVEGNDIVVTGPGNDTVGVGFGNVLVSGGGGALTFINGSEASTVLGGTGTTTIFGGTGGGVFFGGSAGNNVMVAGDGASTLVGGGAGDVLFAAGSTGDMLIASRGNTTLSGGGSTGNNTYFSGAGNDLIGGGVGNDTIFATAGQDTVFGGGGRDVFAFFNDLTSGGNVRIGDFAPNVDKIAIFGYSGSVDDVLARQTQSAAGVTVTLSDGTQITFVGLNELNRSTFT